MTWGWSTADQRSQIM